eukprot:5590255-Prymnesium_polylepis.1
MISRSKKIFTPTDENILSMYYQMFGKEGKLDFEEKTLGLADEDEEGGEEGAEQAEECDED